MKKKVWKN